MINRAHWPCTMIHLPDMITNGAETKCDHGLETAMLFA